MRLDLKAKFGEEYAVFLELMGAIREKVLATEHEPEEHKDLFEKLINAQLMDLIKDGRLNDIDALLEQILGQDFSWESLMLNQI